ncbi:MAG: hypothetical protein OEM15_10390 [Myxococcales bacterium]|nr:hypothetical protein [Myxococcales bacterium]MDH3482906.1 hypothetical protein [Myxococcales bacterium]
MPEETNRIEESTAQGSVYQPPGRAPVGVWIVAILLGVLAIGFNPETLVALGPMRRSLTANDELTRQTALATVRLGRVLLALGAVGTLLLIAMWRPIAGSSWVANVCRHAPAAGVSNDGPIFNRSFRISVGALTASLAYVALAPTLLSEAQRHLVAREDGILEQATAFLFLASSVISMIIAWRLFRKPRPTDPTALRRAVWHLLIGLFFFLCFGEEISWGQRILGFETPESIKEINVQDETNLHNLMGYFADHLFIMGMFVYGSVLPFLARRYEFWRRSLYWFGLPLASLGLAIGFALASGVHDWTLYAVLPSGAGVRAAELREFLTALCCALLMIECGGTAWVQRERPSRTM